MSYDFSSAERGNSFDLIPAKTIAPVRIALLGGDEGTPENAFQVTKSGLYQMALECTVTEGEFAGRKIWHRLTMGAKPGVTMSEGQQKGVSISHSTLRAVLEAARGFAPTDESEKAIAARKMDSLHEIEGLEVWIEVGVEKDKSGQYPDKNKIGRIMPFKADGAARIASAGSGSRPAAASVATATAKKPAWA